MSSNFEGPFFVKLQTTAQGLFNEKNKILIVVIVVSLAQGLISCCDTVWSYVYKDDYQLQPAASSSFSADLQIPWMIKPMWGILSDNFPIFGYKKKSYLIMVAFFAWCSILTFGLWLPPLALGFTILIILNLAQACQSVMAQALLVQDAQKSIQRNDITEDQKKKAASQRVSIFYGTKLAGTIIYSTFIMFLLHESQRKEFLFGTSFIPLGVLVLSFILPEKKGCKILSKPSENSTEALQIELNPSAHGQQPQIEQDTNEENNKASNLTNFKKAIIFLKNPFIYKAMLLLFVAAFVPNAGQGKFYYYTNYLGFDASFLGSLNLVSSGATILGILIYNKFFSHLNLKKLYSCTSLVVCILTLSQLILIYRWNTEIGIPDKLFAALDNFVMTVGGEVNSLPVLVLACRICPKNIEATVFSVLLAINNAGGILSQQLGALLIDLLGITSSDFENLDIMTIITAAFQFLPIILLWTLNYDLPIEEKNHDSNQNTAIRNFDNLSEKAESKIEFIKEVKNSTLLTSAD